MIEDPRLQPLPENMGQIDAVERFLREVVYGFDRWEYDSSFVIAGDGSGNSGAPWEPSAGYENVPNSEMFFRERWLGKLPRIEYFVSSGYIDRTHNSEVFVLTPKALELLKIPSSHPPVFISYRRAESSAFALLIEARIKEQGGSAYLDKYLKGGDAWHNQLEERVKSSKYLVCLIGPTTLESPYVQKEIKWAIEGDVIIIPVCHNGARVEPTAELYKQIIGHEMPNADDIKSDAQKASAAEYETLTNFVLNSLGYGTY